VNVHLIATHLIVTVLAIKKHLKMIIANIVTVGKAKKGKSCVPTTSVAGTVLGIPTTATVLATRMYLKVGAAQSGKQRLWQRKLQLPKGILQKRKFQVRKSSGISLCP